MTKTFRPGERALVSGRYDIRTSRGTATGMSRYVTAGVVFPPTPTAGSYYALTEEVVTVSTTATSAAALDRAATKHSETLRRLAKK